MRFPIAILLVATLFGCAKNNAAPPPVVAAFVPPTPVPPSARAPVCVRPAEKAAFDVSNLKSQLMVTALTCKTEDKYNSFVGRYRSEMVTTEKSLNSFFSRAYGRRGQTEHDDYITQLANAQSQLALKSGQDFCRMSAPMLDQAVALKKDDDLPDFAAKQTIQQSLAVEPCTAPEPKAAPTRAPARKPAVKKS